MKKLILVFLIIVSAVFTNSIVSAKIYVTNYGNDTVIQANLDGTDAISLGNLGGMLSGPTGIAISGGNMYVADYPSGSIIRASLEGTNIVTLGNLGGMLSGPTGIAISGGNMYVTDWINNTVIQANLEGTGGVILPIAILDEPAMIAITQDASPSVPTMTEWGMIIFTVLAGLGAVYYLRRQKTVKS